MALMAATMVSTASVGSHRRLDVDSALECVASDRRNLVDVVFPYLGRKPAEPDDAKYKELFDELERINAEKEASEQSASEEGPGGHDLV